MADFDWSWPKKIDRPLIERALTLDFIAEARNLILLGANGLGKSMIAKNIAYQAVLAGHTRSSVLITTNRTFKDWNAVLAPFRRVAVAEQLLCALGAIRTPRRSPPCSTG